MRFRRIIQLLVVFALARLAQLARLESPPTILIFPNAAVAADESRCSKIGKELLLIGANAVEAAIATAVCVGVLNPQSGGLGGGHFLTVYLRANQSCFIVDAREEAPGLVNETEYREQLNLSYAGWKSIGVPGQIHGFWTAYRQFGGNVPWKDLWKRSIELCRNGFKISEALNWLFTNNGQYYNNSNFSDFINPTTGNFVTSNDTIKLLLLATTMEQIANSSDPVKLFYDSDLSDQIVQEFQTNGGVITREDMRNYKSKTTIAGERPAIYAKLRNNMTLCSAPPPSSGGVTLSILNILNAFNVSKDTINEPDDLSRLFHWFLEASKFSHGIRGQLADMDFDPRSLLEVQRINEPSYATETHDKIENVARPNSSFYGAGPGKVDHGTSHISVVDQNGNAASLTISLNALFGSRIRSEVTGIFYNNVMSDFEIETASGDRVYAVYPTPTNRIEPRKRPLSSMSPLVAFDPQTGHVNFVLGGAGGINIIGAVAQVAMHLLYTGYSIEEAIRTARIHHRLMPYKALYEDGFQYESAGQNITQSLNVTHGHIIEISNSINTQVQGIQRFEDGFLEARTDPRKLGGGPAGF